MRAGVLKSAYVWSILLCGLAVFGGYKIANAHIPHQHLPWKSLSLDAPMGWATRTQLFKLALAPRAQCLAALEAAKVTTAFDVLPQIKTERGCGWQVALETTVNHDTQFYPADVTTLCPMAVANHIWLREVGKLAEETFASKLARVHHFGTYSCRNIAGTNRLSEHAFANAWDVSGFELADGRLISVLKDWDGEAARAEFLRGARDAGCDLYRVVLSPDYNAAHVDHLHLDMGPSSSCR